jgi:hypothetical protein
MKRYIEYTRRMVTLLLATGLMLCSCDSFLSETPYSKISDKQIEDSDAGADMWVAGVYGGLSRMYTYDEFPRCMELDNDYVTGASWAFGEAGAGNFQGATLQVDPLWKLSYELINRGNEARYHVEQMTNLSERHRANTLAEIDFLKAYGYFLIVRAYGACPVYLTSVNQGNDVNQPRKSVTEVYAHIIDLLTNAKDNLYKNTDAGFVEGHVSAGAAASLLAKVYVTIGAASMPSGTVYVKGGNPFTLSGSTKTLTYPQTIAVQKSQVAGYEAFNSQEYYIKAHDLAKEVVVDKLYGNHELLPYATLWKKAGQTSQEHFFRLGTVSGDNYYGALFWRAYCGQIVEGYVPSGGGLSHGLRDHWYKLFDDDRDRRVIEGIQHRYVRHNQYPYGTGSYYPNNEKWKIRATGKNNAGNAVGDGKPVAPFNDGRTYSSGIGEANLAYVTKYEDVTDRSLTRTDAMLPLLRYADVVLIYAEASNEVEGANADALEALNSVRRRSNAVELELGSGVGQLNGKEALRSAIIEERAMELAYEQDRRWDLIRWGIYLQVMNAIGAVDEINTPKSRESKHLLYPIPQDEMLTNKAITENNPGWN